jgi:hypothetical protein
MPQACGTVGDPTKDFLALCAEEPGLRSCVRDLKLPGAGARYPGLALTRPLFVPIEGVVGLADDLVALIDVLESLPDRCFGGSLEAYLAAQGYTPEWIAIMRRGSLGKVVKFGRADVFFRDGKFQVIEINIGSELGGMGVAKLNRGLMRTERFRSFANQHKLGYADPLESLASEVRACAKLVVGADEPRVALVEDVRGPSSQGVAVAEDLNGLGLNVLGCTLADVGWRGGKIVIADRQPVDVVIRFFMLHDLLAQRAGVEKIEMLAEAHKHGRTALFTGLDSYVHSDKASLGLLYEAGIWSSLTESERALVTRTVPWTRLLGDKSAGAGESDRRALIKECVARREGLVLKPSSLSMGTGVVMGADVSEQHWRAALEAPDKPDYVVQERIFPEPESIIDPDTGLREDWDANWGVYFNENGYMGTWIRARRTEEKGIIGLNAGTRPGCAFTY